MKRVGIIVIIALIAVLIMSLVACNTRPIDSDDGTDKADPVKPIIDVQVESIINGSVDGMDCYLDVDPSTSNIDLYGMIEVSKDCVWQLYADYHCQTIIPSTVNLLEGENTYYIGVSSLDGVIKKTYTLHIWRNFYVDICFYSQGEIFKTLTKETHTYISRNEFVEISTTGYTFIGWDGYTPNEDFYITGYDNNNGSLQKTIRFDAIFSANNYIITLDSNGGSCNIDSIDVTYGNFYEIPVPTKIGYTFDGWEYNSTKITATNGACINGYAYGEDITATASWIINSYQLFIDTDNNEGGTVTSSGLREFGSSVTITATPNVGYTFAGWYIGETKISDNTSYTFTMPANDVKYVAKWVINKYTIKLDGNGVECSIESKNVTYGESYTLPVLAREGYTFDGWSYDGTKIVNANGSSVFEYDYSRDITVTAIWKINSYQVTVDKNINGGSVTSSGSKQYNSNVTLTATTKSGYTWLGWYEGDTKVSEGTSLTYTFTMPANNVTYTAKWMSCPVTLTKNISAAGKVSGVDGATAVGTETTITAFTNPGYTWLGWYDGDTLVCDDTTYTFTMTAENKTYTAKWAEYYVTVEKNIEDAGNCEIVGGNNSISFNLNGGSGATPATQNSGTATYPTTIPTRSGYVFAGWYDNQACTGSPYDFTADVTEDTTLYAKWISYSGTGVLTLNSSKSISVVSKSSSTIHYYAFVPLTSGQITIYTTGSLDTYGYLYNSSKSQLTTNDDDGDGNNFSIAYNVTAGMLYYVRPCGYSSSGTTTIHLEGAWPEDGGAMPAPSTKMISAGEEVTITATTDPGYTWLGWYDGDTKVSEDTTHTFTMTAESKIYTARWSKVTIASNNSAAGTITSLNSKSYVEGEEVTVTATTNPGYTWLGWYDGDVKACDELTYTFTMPAENKVYTARWTYYTVSTDTNLEQAGRYTDKTEEKVSAGEMYELIAVTNPGYTWLGWYDGDVKVCDELTYTFTMPAENKVYTARWIVCPVTLEKNIAEAGTVSGIEKTIMGEDTTIIATTNPGYTWLGWYDGETRISDDTTYTFVMSVESKTYTAKWIAKAFLISFDADGGECDTNCVDVTYKQDYVLPVPVKQWCIFKGWYYNGVKIANADGTSVSEYNYTKDITVKAEWSGELFRVTVNKDSSDGIVSASSQCEYNSKVTINATPYLGYAFAGWYQGDTKVSNKANYTFTMPAENLTYTAKFEMLPEMENFEFTSDISKCTINTVIDKTVTTISIPSYVTNIDGGALSGCGKLQSLTLPFVGDRKGITSNDKYQYPLGYIFGSNSYSGGSIIYQCYYDSSITSATKKSFYIPSTLNTVTIEGGYIPYGAFYNCNIADVKIGDNVSAIGGYAFYSCEKLANLTIGSEVEYIGEYAFYMCTNLKKIDIPNSVTTIGNSAFCFTQIESIVITVNVEKIEADAFRNCSKLVSVVFRDTTTWYCSGKVVDVTNPTINAERLKKSIINSTEPTGRYNWTKE